MKRFNLKGDTTGHSRALRREASPVERRLWRQLRSAFPGAHFRRQVPLGHYFADFASHRCKIVIEVDGETHANQAAYDAMRTKFLESEGYTVLRFQNRDIIMNMEGVLAHIAFHLKSPPTPSPSPQGGCEYRSVI